MSRGSVALPLCLFALCLCAAPTATHADPWPRFRGPNGTGVSHDKDVPVKFNAKEGILWKVPLPGKGHSSPVVWGDRLFLQTASADAKDRKLLCLDARSGKMLWERSLKGAKAKIHAKSSLASSTPALDGERVYVAFWDGTRISLTGWDFEGNRLWERDLGKFESQHGAGASPVVVRDKVYFANDQDGASTLYALDAKTGKTVWQAERPPYRACYSAPFVLEKAGAAPELVVVSTGGATGYDPDKGTKLWNWEWKFSSKMPLRTTGSPVFSDGMLVACAGDGGGDRHMVAVKLTGEGTGTEAKLAWENKKDFPYVPTVLVRGDHVYFVNDKGMGGCFEVKTGKRVWFQRVSDVDVAASPVMIDGKIYAPAEDGEVYVFAAEPKFQLLARNSLGEQVVASPAVADNRLYLRGQAHLFCIAKK